jgi:hypothetical protein
MLKLNRLIIGATIFSLLILAPLGSLAHGNERGEAKVTVAGAKVAINYGRPMLKGRDLTKMIQPGQLWRIGADAPTTLESDMDLDIGGTRVPKGKHILLARLVQPGQWSLVFSTKPASQYEPSAKIAEVPLELEQGKDSVELVSLELHENGDHGVIEIAWGTMRLRASFTPAK